MKLPARLLTVWAALAPSGPGGAAHVVLVRPLVQFQPKPELAPSVVVLKRHCFIVDAWPPAPYVLPSNRKLGCARMDMPVTLNGTLKRDGGAERSKGCGVQGAVFCGNT